MATDAETVATIKSQTLAILADITANPRPTYTIEGGRTVEWTEYLRELKETIAWCDERLAAEGA
jgi:hypothetical protein